MTDILPQTNADSAADRLKELSDELVESMTVTLHPKVNSAPVLRSDYLPGKSQIRVYPDGIEYLTAINEEETDRRGKFSPRTIGFSLYVSSLDILVRYRKRSPTEKEPTEE